MGNFTSRSPGKYAGGIGVKTNFRRPLRPDARSTIPEYWLKYMRHDFWWGFGKPVITFAAVAWVLNIGWAQNMFFQG